MKYGDGIAPETIWRVDYSLVLFDRKGGALKREKTLFKARRAHKRKPKKREPPSKVNYTTDRCHMYAVPYKPAVSAYCSTTVLDFISRYVGVKEQRRDGKQLASTLSFHLGCDIVPCVGGLASWVTAHESEAEYQARIVRLEAGI
jgi:hypothetical protein